MPQPTTLPAPADDAPLPFSIHALDVALRAANAEGLLRYTLADLRDAKARIAALEAELAAARGGR